MRSAMRVDDMFAAQLCADARLPLPRAISRYRRARFSSERHGIPALYTSIYTISPTRCRHAVTFDFRSPMLLCASLHALLRYAEEHQY